MDLLDALESMATRFVVEPCEPDSPTIERWRTLFHPSDPYATIMDFRNSLDQPVVSDTLWIEVEAEQRRLGHDRESFAFSLTIPGVKTSPLMSTQPGRGTYLVKILPSCPPLSSATAVQQAISLALPPAVQKDEDSDTLFVRLSGEARIAIGTVLARDYPQVQPTYIRLSMPAPKELDSGSRRPTLGVDTTLPHHRSASAYTTLRQDVVQQNDYPVLYFFYGTLADPEVLCRQMGFEQLVPDAYQPAFVQDARLTTWGGKYNALTDGSERITGSAFMVESKVQEDRLREYETDHYEVVRCEIELEQGELKQGLTFRFVH